jgi:hypothetical protein
MGSWEVTMSQASAPEPAGAREAAGSSRAFSRDAVDVYERVVARRRAELEASIREARTRTVRATLLAERLSTLEGSVGETVVTAYARAAAHRRHRVTVDLAVEDHEANVSDEVEALLASVGPRDQEGTSGGG